jgi:hypothetical protein
MQRIDKSGNLIKSRKSYLMAEFMSKQKREINTDNLL